MGKVLISLEQAKEIGRAMWEVQGLTMPQIGAALGKSLGAIEKWSRQEGWAKKSDLRKAGMGGEVRELTRQKFLDHLAEAGMPPERAAQIMVQGMTEPSVTKTELSKNSDGEIVENVVVQKDHKVIHKYLHDYLLAADAIGGTPSSSTPAGGHGSINIQVNIPEKR